MAGDEFCRLMMNMGTRTSYTRTQTQGDTWVLAYGSNTFPRVGVVTLTGSPRTLSDIMKKRLQREKQTAEQMRGEAFGL